MGRNRQQNWAVYLQPPPVRHAAPENLLKYLARYVTGGQLGDARLISHEDGFVTFWARDQSKTGRRVPVRLAGVEFVRRWSLHILPSGFHRVRYYGGLHPSRRNAYLARCRELLTNVPDVPTAPPAASAVEPTDPPLSAEACARRQVAQGICPHCGGELDLLERQRNRPSWRADFSSTWAPPYNRLDDG